MLIAGVVVGALGGVVGVSMGDGVDEWNDWRNRYRSCSCCELHITLDRDLPLLSPINTMGVSAVPVVSDPVGSGHAPIQLRVHGVVYPHMLSPLGHPCEVRLPPI